MQLRTPVLVFLVAAGGLVACQSTSTTYTPQNGTTYGASPESPAVARLHLPAPYDSMIDLSDPRVASACTAPNVKIPGDYISLLAAGDVKGGTFSIPATAIVASWSSAEYTLGTPTPKPTATPKASPTPKPKFEKVWIYSGTYSLTKSKQTGCTILVTTQSGKPLEPGLPFNASTDGFVQYTQANVNVGKTKLSGTISETISGLSASGGKGSVTLFTMKGSSYDTGTITLTSRVGASFPIF